MNLKNRIKNRLRVGCHVVQAKFGIWRIFSSIVSDHSLLTSQFGNPVSRVWCLTNAIKGLLPFVTCNSATCPIVTVYVLYTPLSGLKYLYNSLLAPNLDVMLISALC